MKIGFNEANDRFCKDHSVLKDLEYCEKYGFDYIDIQSECLDRELTAGKYTLEDLGDFFRTHKIKMLSYNALCFFNMKPTQEEKDEVMAKLDEIIRRCNILGCKMIVVVPSKDMEERGLTPSRKEIREDAVAVIREMIKKTEPHGIKLSIEFCGEPAMTIRENRNSRSASFAMVLSLMKSPSIIICPFAATSEKATKPSKALSYCGQWSRFCPLPLALAKSQPPAKQSLSILIMSP